MAPLLFRAILGKAAVWCASNPSARFDAAVAYAGEQVIDEMGRTQMPIPAGSGPMSEPIEAGETQAATLLDRACLPFLDQPDLVRAWAVAHHLRRLSRPQSMVIWQGAPAAVFVGRASGGILGLVSADNGSCAVDAAGATQLGMQGAFFGSMLQDFHQAPISVSPRTINGLGMIGQTFRVNVAGRNVLFFISSQVDERAVSSGVTVSATVERN